MTLNENLGQWSEMLMFLAALVYVVAFVAFTWDLASHSRATRRAEEATRAESGDAAFGLERVPAGVAAGGAGADAGIDAGAGSGAGRGQEGAAPSGRAAPGYPEDAAEQTGVGTRGRGRSHAEKARLAGQTADDAMLYSGERRPAANVAVAVMVLAAVVHLAGVVTRGLAAGRVPWGNMYEFCTTGALVVSAVFLISLLFRDLRFVGTLVSGLALVMMVAATIGFPTPVGHLQPALQSYWLVIHVSVAVMASGVFTITFAMAVLQLLQGWRERRLIEGERDRMPFLRLVPSAQALENFAFRLNAVGFVMWTITLAFGAIWAEQAWGRYWGWDAKEVWTFVIWVVYAAYLHARATRGWTGARSAWLSIIGYACIIFNFTAVNTVFNGLHSYSGL